MSKPLTVDAETQLQYVKNLRAWYKSGKIVNEGDTGIRRPPEYKEQSDPVKDIIIIPYAMSENGKESGSITMNRANFSVTEIDNIKLKTYQHEKDFLEKALPFKAVSEAFSTGDKKAYNSNIKSVFVMLTSECARNKVVSMVVNKFLEWGSLNPHDAELNKEQMSGLSLQFKDYSKIVLAARKGKKGFEYVTDKNTAIVARKDWEPLNATELSELSKVDKPTGMSASVASLNETNKFLDAKVTPVKDDADEDTTPPEQEPSANEDNNEEDTDKIPEVDPEVDIEEKI